MNKKDEEEEWKCREWRRGVKRKNEGGWKRRMEGWGGVRKVINSGGREKRMK